MDATDVDDVHLTGREREVLRCSRRAASWRRSRSGSGSAPRPSGRTCARRASGSGDEPDARGGDRDPPQADLKLGAPRSGSPRSPCCCAVGAAAAGPAEPGADDRRLPGLPRLERLEPAGRQAAGREGLGGADPLDRARLAGARRLRLGALRRPADRDPVRRRLGRCRRRRSRPKFDYADESDAGPYPIPAQRADRGRAAPGDGDRHALIVDRDTCTLYELYALHRPASGWAAGLGRDLEPPLERAAPAGWTSADAAGLPILPGLARYDEVAAGAIDHALRFTAPDTRRAYIYPARHYASDSTDPSLPPMGLRVRLKASFDTSGFPPQARVVLEALKRYGMILADNGSPWYISGAPDPRWSNDDLHSLGRLTGADFEVVDTSKLRP